ncbi:MAG: FG-GAP-like repeat-containing protein [Candidatus Hinthialibacter antarcticus]|nr:FG-GAP-like repeat-containing protein [Candidatus Hinthialibacter antarcticus]
MRLRIQIYISIFFAISLFVFSVSAQPVIRKTQTTTDTRISIKDFDYQFTIPSENLSGDEGVVCEVSVAVNITHENTSELTLWLKPPSSLPILLYQAGEPNPPGQGETLYSTSSSLRLHTDLYSQAGRSTIGNWTLIVQDNVEGTQGTLNSWRLIVPYVREEQIARFSAQTGSQHLEVGVDGYGAFGNLSKRTDYNLGASHDVEQLVGVEVGSTVYQSALSLNETILAGLHLFQDRRLPPVNVIQEGNNRYSSKFSVGGIDVSLFQTLLVENDTFLLRQIYEFKTTDTSMHQFNLMRFFNAKLIYPGVDEIGILNHAYIYTPPGKATSPWYNFNQINSLEDETNYVSMGGLSSAAVLTGLTAGSWFDFLPVFLTRGTQVFNPTVWLGDWNDNNFDGLTDLDSPMDIAQVLGWTVTLNDAGSALFVAETRWGVDSPQQIISQIIGPPTPTPTPKPENLLPPFWVEPLPDLRLLVGENAGAILDLDDYVEDPDSNTNELVFSLESERDLPFSINNENQLTCDLSGFSPPDGMARIGDQGALTITAFDGLYSVSETIRIKTSTFQLRHTLAGPPISISPNGEDDITIALDELVLVDGGGDEIIWSINSSLLPSGVEVNIDENNLAHISGAAPEHLSLVPLIARRSVDGSQETPVPTSTPTLEPSPTPSLTPTWTPNPPTQTTTPTLTPTAVPTVTPLPPTPTSTLTPTSTPTRPPIEITPTATPTPVCSDAFKFFVQPEVAAFEAPSAVVFDDEQKRMFVGHYFDGSIAEYRFENGGLHLQQNIAGRFGLRDIALGDLNGDNRVDVIGLNTDEKEMLFYQGTESGALTQSASILLTGETLLHENSVSLSSNIQAIAAADVDGDGDDEAIVSAADAVLIYYWTEIGWNLLSRLDVDAQILRMVAADLDGDSDADLALGVRASQHDEIRVFINEEGSFRETQRLATDLSINGDFVKQLVVRDWTGDGVADLAALLFSDTVHFYRGLGGVNFELVNASAPFPPGVIDSIVPADFDGDGRVDLAGLHRGIDGLTVFMACGDNFSFRRSIGVKVLPSAPADETYMMTGFDVEGDGDFDLLTVRSLRDRMILLENQAIRP